MMDRRHVLSALAALATVSLSHESAAQPGSGKPLRIIVPFAPGGSGDITARMLGEFITRKTGQAVVVENKPGANGIIGVEAAKRSPADGSVLMLATTSTHLANPSLYKSLPYDPEKDFTLVGHFGGGSILVLVRPSGPYKTLADLVNAARANPEKLNYGHFNASSHIPGAMISKLAGVKMTPVPYKQIASAMTDLISGQLDVIFVDSVAGDSYASSGQLRAIAAYGQRRLPKYPDVPLITETYPTYNVSAGMLGIAVPRGTPQAVSQSLNDLVNEAISTDPMKAALENFGFHPRPMPLADLAAYVTRERALWKEQVEMAGIVPQ
jgi:tripartite-type tricarboxylate transporter receptor subunit TctC